MSMGKWKLAHQDSAPYNNLSFSIQFKKISWLALKYLN